MIRFLRVSLFLFTVSLSALDWDDPRTHLHFADHLADSGDFYRAITEYRRVLYHFPEYEKNNWVHFQIGRMYYYGGRFANAKDSLIPLTIDPDPRLNFLSHNFLALTYFDSGEYVNASRLFRELSEHPSAVANREEYIVYAAMSDIRHKKFSQALDILAPLEKNSSSKEFKEFATLAMDKSRAADKKKPKNKFLSTTLAVLFPGAGHMYLGEWDNAFVALSIVGATGYLAYEGFVNANTTQSILFTTFSSGFYAGSIYSAYSQTEKYNNRIGNEEIQSVAQKFSRLRFSLSTAF